MSLYNMLFGVNPVSDVLLSCIGLTTSDVPRFRDCFIGDDGASICVYTRTGGGNREYYDSLESCKECYPEYFKEPSESPTGPWNEDLRSNPFFLSDQDDDYDCTYANFYFRFPDEYKEELSAIGQKQQVIQPSQKWEALLASMKGAN